jgi:hypothetical protein
MAGFDTVDPAYACVHPFIRGACALLARRDHSEFPPQ